MTFPITFGNLSYSYIIPFFYSISCYARGFTTKIKEFNKEKGDRPFIFTTLCSLAELTCGIFYILSKRIEGWNKTEVKKMTKKGDQEMRENMIYHSDSSKLKNEKTMMIIPILSLFNYLFCQLAFSLGHEDKIIDYNYQYQIGILTIAWITFLSHFCLKLQIALHHIVSIAFIVFLECLLCLNLLSVKKIPFKSLFFDFFLLLICDLFFSTKHCVEKYMMDFLYMNPYKLIFLEGLYGVILNFIGIGIFNFVPCPGLKYCEKDSSMMDVKNILNYITEKPLNYFLFYLGSIGVNLLVLLTIKEFSPAHRCIFDIFTSFLQSLIGLISGSTINTAYSIFQMICFVFIIFWCLVYNEIIILNFCKMGYNTKKEISERASVDMTCDISGEFKIDGEEIKSINKSNINDMNDINNKSNDISDINNKSNDISSISNITDQSQLMNSF